MPQAPINMNISDAFLSFLQQPGLLYGVLLGFILCALVILLFTLRRRQNDRFEAFTNEFGKVMISRQALEDQIQRCCEELAEVGKARATIDAKGDLLAIQIQLQIRSHAKLTGISGYMQQQIDHALRRNLGIENVGPINIVVTGLLPSTIQEQLTRIQPDERPDT